MMAMGKRNKLRYYVYESFVRNFVDKFGENINDNTENVKGNVGKHPCIVVEAVLSDPRIDERVAIVIPLTGARTYGGENIKGNGVFSEMMFERDKKKYGQEPYRTADGEGWKIKYKNGREHEIGTSYIGLQSIVKVIRKDENGWNLSGNDFAQKIIEGAKGIWGKNASPEWLAGLERETKPQADTDFEYNRALFLPLKPTEFAKLADIAGRNADVLEFVDPSNGNAQAGKAAKRFELSPEAKCLAGVIVKFALGDEALSEKAEAAESDPKSLASRKDGYRNAVVNEHFRGIAHDNPIDYESRIKPYVDKIVGVAYAKAEARAETRAAFKDPGKNLEFWRKTYVLEELGVPEDTAVVETMLEMAQKDRIEKDPEKQADAHSDQKPEHPERKLDPDKDDPPDDGDDDAE
jgi:hypothetical protein